VAKIATAQPRNGASVQIKGTRIVMTPVGETVVFKRVGTPATARVDSTSSSTTQARVVRPPDLVGQWVVEDDTIGDSTDFRSDSTFVTISPLPKGVIPPDFPEQPIAIKLMGSWSLAEDTLTTVVRKGVTQTTVGEYDMEWASRAKPERKLVQLKSERLIMTRLILDAKKMVFERDSRP
jgi:hypothetical protein